MQDPSPRPATDPTPLWRIRHSPVASGAAMVLFLVVSALWLVPAGTAQVWVHSMPPCLGPACPPPPSYTSLHILLLLGIAGAVLTFASFALVVRRAVGGGRKVGTARPVRRVVVTGFAGALAEVIVVLLVTHVAIVTAPLGFENSGEAGAAIGILSVAQPTLAGALALVWGRLLRVNPGEPPPSTRRIRPWRACSASVAWCSAVGRSPPGASGMGRPPCSSTRGSSRARHGSRMSEHGGLGCLRPCWLSRSWRPRAHPA
jgi:hypothetical protein